MDKDPCEQAMKLLGDFWTLRIINALKDKEVRFCELQRELNNINPVTLTKRLKVLEDANLVDRTGQSVDKISVTYKLTELGGDALGVVRALNRFSQKAQAVN